MSTLEITGLAYVIAGNFAVLVAVWLLMERESTTWDRPSAGGEWPGPFDCATQRPTVSRSRSTVPARGLRLAGRGAFFFQAPVARVPIKKSGKD
jgi:hypothetical protein